MSRIARAFGVGVGVATAAITFWDLWGRFVQVEADSVPYTVLEREGRIEFREYPDMVVATSVAETEREAFNRLYAYIDGANQDGTDVAMTAPVATSSGADVPMTAPVASRSDESGVSMTFFLPPRYTLGTAPEPMDDRVEVELLEHRRVAVYPFSGVPTDRKVERARQRLERALEEHDVDTDGDPELYRYDGPRTPPWQRLNELVIPL